MDIEKIPTSWYRLGWDTSWWPSGFSEAINAMQVRSIHQIMLQLYERSESAAKSVTDPMRLVRPVRERVLDFLEPFFSLVSPTLLLTTASAVVLLYVSLDTQRDGTGTFARNMLRFFKAVFVGLVCVQIIANPFFFLDHAIALIHSMYNELMHSVVDANNNTLVGILTQYVNYGGPLKCSDEWYASLSENDDPPWPSCAPGNPEKVNVMSKGMAISTAAVMFFRLLFVGLQVGFIYFLMASAVALWAILGWVGLLSLFQRKTYSWLSSVVSSAVANTLLFSFYVALGVAVDMTAMSFGRSSGNPQVMMLAIEITYAIGCVLAFVLWFKGRKLLRQKVDKSVFATVKNATDSQEAGARTGAGDWAQAKSAAMTGAAMAVGKKAATKAMGRVKNRRGGAASKPAKQSGGQNQAAAAGGQPQSQPQPQPQPQSQPQRYGRGGGGQPAQPAFAGNTTTPYTMRTLRSPGSPPPRRPAFSANSPKLDTAPEPVSKPTPRRASTRPKFT